MRRMNQKIFTLRLPESLWEMLSEYADEHGQTKAGVLKMALYEFITKEEGK